MAAPAERAYVAAAIAAICAKLEVGVQQESGNLVLGTKDLVRLESPGMHPPCRRTLLFYLRARTARGIIDRTRPAWLYDARVTDEPSGASGRAKRSPTAQDAVERAVRQCVEQMRKQGGFDAPFAAEHVQY